MGVRTAEQSLSEWLIDDVLVMPISMRDRSRVTPGRVAFGCYRVDSISLDGACRGRRGLAVACRSRRGLAVARRGRVFFVGSFVI